MEGSRPPSFTLFFTEIGYKMFVNAEVLLKIKRRLTHSSWSESNPAKDDGFKVEIRL
jgi:hypothetical protein